jgi:hypothetical protein
MEEREGSSFDEDSLKKAALDMLDQFECSAERAGDAAEVMLDVVANLALPETQPSLGGGQSNNDLPKKGGRDYRVSRAGPQDEEWYWWKGGRDYRVSRARPQNGFIRQQNNRGRKR